MKPENRPRSISPGPRPKKEDKAERSSAYREYSERMTISMPKGLADVLRAICLELDLEYSKVFRRGLDRFIEEKHRNHEISSHLYARFQAFRRSVEHWD
jgi:hypothetical protein